MNFPLINKLFGIFSKDLAIDLGTSNICVYEKGKGIIMREPSVVAVKINNKGVPKILAIGELAKKMLGRAPVGVETHKPMQNGVINNIEMSECMFRHLFSVAHGRRSSSPRLMICVPIGCTPVEERAVRDAAQLAGAREVYLMEEPMAAAIGAGLPVAEPISCLIADIGGGITEISIISLGGIVYCNSVRTGGDKMNESIVQYVRTHYGLLIGLDMAEELKCNIGTVCESMDMKSMQAKGRDLASGLPKALDISARDIRQAVSEHVSAITHAIMNVLENCPPELSADLVERGLVLTGGGSLLHGLDTLLHQRTKMPVIYAADPLTSVARGLGAVLEDIDLYKDVLKTE